MLSPRFFESGHEAEGSGQLEGGSLRVLAELTLKVVLPTRGNTAWSARVKFKSI